MYLKYDYYLLIVLATFLLIPSITYGQVDEAEIMLSGDYHYAEAYELDLEAARKIAMQNLIRQFRVRIQSTTQLYEEEINDDFQSEFTRQINETSEMELMGLRYLERERGNGSWRVIAYISKEDYERSMEENRLKIYSLLDEALSQERSVGMRGALPIYYELYIESSTSPFILMSDPERHGIERNVTLFARQKLTNWLSDVEIKVNKVRDLSGSDFTELYFDLHVESQGEAVNHLEIRVLRPGLAFRSVVGGRVELFYDAQPRNVIEPIDLQIKLQSPRTLNNGQNNGKFQNEISEIRRIDVDFSDLIRPDFTIERLSDTRFRFIPNVGTLLSISSLSWDFGDGIRSSDLQPTHSYERIPVMEVVTMTVNRSDRMRVQKRVNQGTQPQQLMTERTVVQRELEGYSPYTVPNRYRNQIENISEIRYSDTLQGYLNVLLRDNYISMPSTTSPGAQSEANHYIIIFDPNGGEPFIRAILSPVRNGVRYDVSNNNMERYSAIDWKDEFRGFAPLWVQFR